MLRVKMMLSVIAGITMLFGAEVWAASTCHDVHVETNASALDPMLIFGKYAGTAYISMDGQTPIPAAVSFAPFEVKVGDDGSVHPTSQLTFDLGLMGALTFLDNAVMSPTENPYVYTMNTRLDIVSGTGMFMDVFGKFSAHGQYSLMTAGLSAVADGRICW